jgi:hypothetical protein
LKLTLASQEGCSRLFTVIPGDAPRACILRQGDGYHWTFVFHLTGNDFKDNVYKVLWFFIGLHKYVCKEGNLGLTCNSANCRVMRKVGDSRMQKIVTGIEVRQAYERPGEDNENGMQQRDTFADPVKINRDVQFGAARNFIALEPFDVYMGITAAISTDQRGKNEIHKFAVISVVPRRNVHMLNMINSYFDATEKAKETAKLAEAKAAWKWLLLHEFHGNLGMPRDVSREMSMFSNNPCGDMGADNVFCVMWTPFKICNVVRSLLQKDKRTLSGLKILHIAPEIDTK